MQHSKKPHTDRPPDEGVPPLPIRIPNSGFGVAAPTMPYRKKPRKNPPPNKQQLTLPRVVPNLGPAASTTRRSNGSFVQSFVQEQQDHALASRLQHNTDSFLLGQVSSHHRELSSADEESRILKGDDNDVGGEQQVSQVSSSQNGTTEAIHLRVAAVQALGHIGRLIEYVYPPTSGPQPPGQSGSIDTTETIDLRATAVQALGHMGRLIEHVYPPTSGPQPPGQSGSTDTTETIDLRATAVQALEHMGRLIEHVYPPTPGQIDSTAAHPSARGATPSSAELQN